MGEAKDREEAKWKEGKMGDKKGKEEEKKGHSEKQGEGKTREVNSLHLQRSFLILYILCQEFQTLY